MEDTRLTKAADLAAKQRVLLASDVPDAWKRPQLKAVGVNYAIAPKKYANRLVPRSVAWVAQAPLPLLPARTILMPAPCKLD